jgi:hypothetical protein
MILVKSLIWLLLILIGFYAYDHFHLLAYFDGREGFKQQEAGSSEAGAGASEAGAGASEAGAGASEAGASEAGASEADNYTIESILKASKDLANTTIEMKFSENKPLDMRKELANDSEEISKLQEKINDLLKLKDQAKDINNNLRTNK